MGIEPLQRAADQAVAMVPARVRRRFFNPLRQGVEPAARWIELLGRVGHLARAIVYGLVGILAAQAALSAAESPDTSDAMEAIRTAPFGRILLAAVAAGLVCFAAWRFVEAWCDTEHRGRDLKGVLTRIGFAAAGVTNLFLAAAAVLVIWNGRGPDGEGQRRVAADVMEWPGGWLFVIAVGLVVFAIGAGHFVAAYKARFMAEYDHTEMSDAERKLAKPIGRFGLSARGATFCVIGLFLALAGWRTNAGEVKSLGGAFTAVAAQPYGRFLLLFVAAGFIAYAVYCLSRAKYKRFAK